MDGLLVSCLLWNPGMFTASVWVFRQMRWEHSNYTRIRECLSEVVSVLF